MLPSLRPCAHAALTRRSHALYSTAATVYKRDMPDVVVRLLGPLEVGVSGRPVELRRQKQRALLALLALRAGEVVSIDRLVDELWVARRAGRKAPPSSRRDPDRQRRFPLLRTRVTLVPAARRAPARGDWETTRPLRIEAEYDLRMAPTLQPARRIALRAAAAVLPLTFGTTQARVAVLRTRAVVSDASVPEPPTFVAVTTTRSDLPRWAVVTLITGPALTGQVDAVLRGVARLPPVRHRHRAGAAPLARGRDEDLAGRGAAAHERCDQVGRRTGRDDGRQVRELRRRADGVRRRDAHEQAPADVSGGRDVRSGVRPVDDSAALVVAVAPTPRVCERDRLRPAPVPVDGGQRLTVDRIAGDPRVVERIRRLRRRRVAVPRQRELAGLAVDTGDDDGVDPARGCLERDPAARPARPVVARDLAEAAERRADVRGDDALGTAGLERRPAARRGGPLEPDRGEAVAIGVLRLARLTRRAFGGAGRASGVARERNGCGEVVVRRCEAERELDRPRVAAGPVDRDPVHRPRGRLERQLAPLAATVVVGVHLDQVVDRRPGVHGQQRVDVARARGERGLTGGRSRPRVPDRRPARVVGVVRLAGFLRRVDVAAGSERGAAGQRRRIGEGVVVGRKSGRRAGQDEGGERRHAQRSQARPAWLDQHRFLPSLVGTRGADRDGSDTEVRFRPGPRLG